MSNKKAFSMLEILIVAGLLLTALTAAISMRSSSAIANQEISGLEEYYNLQARLTVMLQQDLRSAYAIRKINEGHYEFSCLELGPASNVPEQYTVVYQTTGRDGLKVERRHQGRLSATYDFSATAAGRKFKFAITEVD